MIISGTIDLDPAAHTAATAALRSRLERLEERRRAAEQAVDHVLASWRGAAADGFRVRWSEWNRGALAVIDHLTDATESLDLVRRELTSVDRERAQSSVRLVGRLG